jgi:hypothetical protein
MRQHRRFLAPAGMVTAGAGLLLGLSVPLLAGPAAAAPAVNGCAPAHAVTAYHFTINGKTASTLRNLVHQGDQVEAFFAISSECSRVPMALVAHTAPDAFFVPGHVSLQRVSDEVKASFNSGTHTMGPVHVPPCDFQVDFEALATKTSPGFTYSSATGGTTSCNPGTTTTTAAPTTTTEPQSRPPASVAPTSVTTAQVLASRTPAPATLPFTGSDTGLLVGIAAALLVSGGAMIALARRSLRPTS